MIFSRREIVCGKESDARRMERWWRIGVLVFAILGLAYPAGAVLAIDVSTVVNYVLILLAHVLGWIINMIGNLVVMLVDLVVQVSQYNTFIKAHPVQVGWPLIRDVTNMFFIVILLLIAFSVIIRWSKFNNWKGTLPKFLLMAILINFSLPLIGLMIDFSQVIMLTFVNGFSAAATGNFVQVLKLDRVMSLSANQNISLDGDGPQDPQLVKLVVAEMFGIFILGVTCTLLFIMALYLIVRIVALWVALIMSPLAFFMTAVPSALTSKLSVFSDGYWNKLSQMLVGGPTMAFFLWLTLATVQTGGIGTITPANYAGQGEQQQVEQYFSSAIGSVEEFGIYLFGIIMMFTGLSAAVQSSSQLSSTLGSVTGKIKSGGIWASKMAAYGGVMAGGAYGARKMYQGTAATGRFAANRVDQRLDLTKKVGSAMKTVGLKLRSDSMVQAGAAIGSIRGRAVKERGEEFDERVKSMKLSPEQYLKYAQRLEKASGNRDIQKAMNERILRKGMTKEGSDELLKQYESSAKESALRAGLNGAENATEAEKKEFQSHVDAFKRQRVQETMAERMRKYEDANKGDDDKMKFAKDTIEANPSLAKDTYKYVMEQMEKDPNSYKKFRIQEFENTDVMRAIMAHESNVFKDDGELDKLHPLYNAFKGNGERAKLFRAYAKDLQMAAPDRDPKKLLDDEGALRNAGLAGGRYMRTGDKDHYPNGYRRLSVAELSEAAGAPVAAAAGAPAVVRAAAVQEIRAAEERVAQARARVEHVRAMPAGAARDTEEQAAHEELRQAQQRVTAVGGRVEQAFNVDERGAFRDDRDQQNYAQNVTELHQQAQTNVDVYNNVDMEMIARNPAGRNEVRSTFVENTNVEDLKHAYRQAEQSGKAESLRGVSNVVRAVEMEGTRIENLIKSQNAKIQKSNQIAVKQRGDQAELTSSIDENKIFQAALKNDQSALKEALGDSGLALSMNEAKALAKKHEVVSDETLSNFKDHATSRGRIGIEKAKRVGGDIASTTAEKVVGAASVTAGAVKGAATTVASKTSGAVSAVGARARRMVGREGQSEFEARMEQQSTENEVRSAGQKAKAEQRRLKAAEKIARARDAAAPRTDKPYDWKELQQRPGDDDKGPKTT